MNTTTETAPLRIEKVLRVIDTRAYEEAPNDRWIPIPGSGSENQCFRCGRTHEVHAHVKLSDGREVICGTACGREESADVQGAIKSATSAAKRLAALRARKVSDEAKLAEIKRIQAIVDAMTPPVIVETTGTFSVGMNAGKTYIVIAMGEERIPCFNGVIDAERRACLLDCWKRSQMSALNAPRYPYGAHETVKRIAKLERQIAAL